MLLENMMEDKQLNLSRPLLSVRRHSSTSAVEKNDKRNTRSFLPSVPRPPFYKSELKSGPVSNPGAVPFQWERSPGRPKDERTPENHTEGPPVAPKLPPGRILIANQQDNDNASTNAVVNKSQDRKQNGLQNVSHFDEYNRGIEGSEETMEKAVEEKAESGDEDEVYEDALDTLSRTESFSLNCSVSGISGLDESYGKPSGTSFTDPQAKEFMIGRFLPAAKAMISETPQYAPPSKKQPMIDDHPRQLMMVQKGDNRPQLRYGPSFARHYAESQYAGVEESDDEYDENENFHGKACGLLPKFCLKSSMCLLNPLPAMSMRTRVPISPARKVHARSSSTSTCSKTENELSSFDASEQRSIDGSQTELLEDKNDVKNKSNEIFSLSQKLKESSSYDHDDLSGRQNESSVSVEQGALTAISMEVTDVSDDGFRPHAKGYKSFRELLADDNMSEEVDSRDPAVEKTLYINTVHKGESMEQKRCTFDSKGLTNLGKDVDEVSEKMVTTNLSEDPLLVKKLSDVDEGDALMTDFQKAINFSLPSLANKTSQMIENDAPKALGEDEHLYQDAVDSEILEMPVKRATQSLRKQTPKEEKVEIFHGLYSEFPVPPPLPNSPSDSWLCRTLPSMSLKNSSRHYHFGTGINLRNQASKTQSGNPKWETIVRATKVHHQHLRYSEELLAPVPES